MTTSTRSNWMLYGAYGTTGRLILDEALRRGHRPLLAGRDSVQLSALRQATGLSAPLTPVQAFGSEFASLVPGTRIEEI